MIVSDVGRTISGSSSFLPPPCVTTAVSGAKPSTCSASLVQEALGNEQREVRVLVARLLEHVVERALHALPDAVAVRANDHAAAHGRVVGELGAEHDFVVPGAEVVRARGELLLVCHVLVNVEISGCDRGR